MEAGGKRERDRERERERERAEKVKKVTPKSESVQPKPRRQRQRLHTLDSQAEAKATTWGLPRRRYFLKRSCPPANNCEQLAAKTDSTFSLLAELDRLSIDIATWFSNPKSFFTDLSQMCAFAQREPPWLDPVQVTRPLKSSSYVRSSEALLAQTGRRRKMERAETASIL